MPTLRTAVTLIALGGPATAVQFDEAEDPYQVPLFLNQSDQFSPLSWGNLDNDFLPDLLTVRNGSARVYNGVAVYSFGFPVELPDGQVPSASAAIFVRSNDGSPDSVAIGHSTGVDRFSFHGTVWSSTPLLATPPWASPKFLRSADMDQDGTEDLLIVDATGTQVALILDVNATPVADPILWPALAHPVTGIVVGNFSGDNHRECAVGDAHGVAIRDASGALLFPFASGRSGGLMTTVERPRSARDSLACIVENAGARELVFLGASGLEAPLPLPGTTFGDMVSEDIDGDGRGDLLLTHRGLGQVQQLLQQPAPPSFQWTSGSHLIDLGEDLPPTLDNECFAGLSDYDGDGDVDALIVREAIDSSASQTHQWIKILNPRISAKDQMPSLSEAWFTYHADSDSAQFQLAIDAADARVTGLTDIQLIAWNELNGIYPEPSAFLHQIFPGSGGPELLDFTVDGEFSPSDAAFQHYQLRWVDWNGEEVVAAGPTAVYSVTANTDAHHLRQASAGIPVPFVVFEGNLVWDGGIDQPTPGVVDVPALPAMAGTVLHVGEPTVND